MSIGLGTQLRLLTDALDGAVDAAYRAAGLDFRARFYPYFRLLAEKDGLAVGELAASLGFTQPAVTQSLALMRQAQLVEPAPSDDKRERRYRLTAKSRAMLPALRRIWAVTGAAAARLDRNLPAPLGETIQEALRLLSRKPFGEMIGEELRHAEFADRPMPVPAAARRAGDRAGRHADRS